MSRRRILAVDDTAVFVDLVKDYLGKVGCEVVGCANAGEARRALSAETFDLVISDMDMPQEDGLAFCRALRTEAPRIPVVLMLSRQDAELKKRCAQAGAAAVIHKPLQEQELVRTTFDLLHLELRRKVRMPLELQLEVGASRRAFSSISVDMSVSGVFLRTTENVGLGQRVHIKMRIAEEDLHLQGHVTRHSFDEASGLFGLGIQFADLDAAKTHLLEHYLRSCAAGS